MIKTTWQIIIIVIGAFILSCEGPEGPTGPKGEVGPQGPKGEPGSANVTSTEFTVSSSNTQIQENVGLSIHDAPEITQDVYENGSVQAYFDLADFWTALPFSVDSGGDIIQTTYGYETGSIAIITTSTGSQLFSFEIQEGQFKRTVIPPVGSSKVITTESGMKFPEGTPQELIDAVLIKLNNK